MPAVPTQCDENIVVDSCVCRCVSPWPESEIWAGPSEQPGRLGWFGLHYPKASGSHASHARSASPPLFSTEQHAAEQHAAESMEGWDKGTKSTVGEIPLLTTRAGPRDGEAWRQRLKEEYRALIAYTSVNKAKDNDWFRIAAANPEGTRWEGTCWYVHNLRRYEFPLQFDIPVAYPQVAPEIELPTLDGKTHKVS